MSDHSGWESYYGHIQKFKLIGIKMTWLELQVSEIGPPAQMVPNPIDQPLESCWMWCTPDAMKERAAYFTISRISYFSSLAWYCWWCDCRTKLLYYLLYRVALSWEVDYFITSERRHRRCFVGRCGMQFCEVECFADRKTYGEGNYLLPWRYIEHIWNCKKLFWTKQFHNIWFIDPA